MVYEVYINGVEYPVTRVKFRRVAYSLDAQEITVEVSRLISTTLDHFIEVKRDGVTWQKGRLARASRRADENGAQTRVRGFDLKRKLATLDAVQTAPNTQAGTHISNQFTNTDLSVGTFNTYGLISLEYGQDENSRYDRRRPIEDALFGTGWELYVNPAGVCDFKAQVGTDRSATLAFRRGENLLKWVNDEEYVESGLLKVKKIKVIGKGVGTYLAYGIATSGGYAAGDPEKSINRKSLINTSICNSAAIALLSDMENTLKYGAFHIVDPKPGVNFDIFDKVRVVDDLLGVDEVLRIAAIDVEWSPEEGENIIVTVTNIQHLQTAGEFLIGEIKSRETDDYGRIAQVPNIDSLPDGDAYKRIVAAQVTNGQVIYNTADKDGLNPALWEGRVVYDTGEDRCYSSSGTEWVDVNLTGQDVWGFDARRLTHGFTAATMKRYFLHGADGDKTFSSSGSFPRHIMFYNNLTINGGVTVDCVGEVQYVFVKGTLTLNGTIRAQNGAAGGDSGSGANNRGGNGGKGGSAVIVFASVVTGTGTVTAAGANGETPTEGLGTGGAGINGTAGSFKNIVLSAGSGGPSTGSSGGAGGTATPTGVFSLIDELEVMLEDSQGAGGGEGSLRNDSALIGNGGGGGAGAWGSGGAGGTQTGVNPDTEGKAGGGGGGGGFAMIVSFGNLPAITVNAQGGNGGSSYIITPPGTMGGGGGGGGGIAVAIAPNVASATITISAGAGGNNGGSNGVNGRALAIAADPAEVLL